MDGPTSGPASPRAPLAPGKPTPPEGPLPPWTPEAPAFPGGPWAEHNNESKTPSAPDSLRFNSHQLTLHYLAYYNKAIESQIGTCQGHISKPDILYLCKTLSEATLTAGPGSPSMPASPLSPGWPTMPRCPEAPAGPGGPSGPWEIIIRTDKQLKHLRIYFCTVMLLCLNYELKDPLTPGPSSPESPFSPALPGAPVVPLSPWRPWAPLSPMIPEGPCFPVAPIGPSAPTAPWNTRVLCSMHIWM